MMMMMMMMMMLMTMESQMYDSPMDCALYTVNTQKDQHSITFGDTRSKLATKLQRLLC